MRCLSGTILTHDLMRPDISGNTQFSQDRSSTWKIIEVDDSFRIEYKDAAGNIYRTEYYNSNGELI